MADIENVLSSMSTAFNSSPTPGDEASVIDLIDDKTLKWRRHLNNQYAKKNPNRKSLVDDDLEIDESLTGKYRAASEDGNENPTDGVATTPKASTPLHRSAEERIRSTSPSTPEPAAPASSSSVAATAAAASTSAPMQSAVAVSDNAVISATSVRDEPAKTLPADMSVRTQKPKKSPRNVQENPSRRSNRTRNVPSVSPAPQRRRGRSKKVEDPTSIDPDAVGEEPVKVEVEPSSSSPNRTVENDERHGPALVQENSVREVNESKDTTISVQNGDDVPVVKDFAKETNQEAIRNRKRRSVRLETKSDTAEAADKSSQNDTPAEKISKQQELPAEAALKATDHESIKIEPPSPPPKVLDKIPKKRGRRPKSVISPATSSSDVPLLSKKSPRQSRDGAENGSQEKTSLKDNRAPISASLESKPSATSQRPLRRIKPTAKILENDELRYEFESKNIARIVATTSGSPPGDGKPTTGNSSEYQRASRSRDAKDASHLDGRNHITPVKKKTMSTLNVDNIYPTQKSRPCPEPQDFLNEIKASGINLNRSPEDKKLNRKQHRKLLKQKEKHFERLGLRRNVQDDITDSDNSSSDNDEFIPSKKINVGKPNVTLRIRNNKENTTTATSTPKQQLSKPRDQRPGPPKKVTVPGVEPEKKVVSNSKSPADGDLKMICLCQTKPKFYARKNSEVVYCKAIDHVEDHRVGCFNRIQNAEIFPLYRPSTRVPYLLLCDQHLIRFRSHNCCAGCGLFCTQGSFILCKHRHFFHPSCAEKFVLNTPYDPSKRSSYPSPKLVLKCPHCGCDTSEKESLVTMKCRNTPVFLPSQKGPIKPAKMGLSSSNGRRVSIVRQQSQQCLDLVKYIPESVMNVVVRENGASINDFTTKDVFYAVNNDDLERVAEIIRSGFDITSEMKEFLDGTCLHLVAHFGTIQMACLLLSRNSTSEFLNKRDKEGRTAAMCAILGDKCDILQLFIQVGADISLKGEDGLTCLHFASRNDNLQAAKILLESYCSTASFKQFNDYLNAKDDGGWTSLIWATELNHTSIVSLLLNYDADASICDMENNTALHWAVISSCDDIVKILLQADARCSVQNISGDTPLHIACRQTNTCAALMLIARGADLMVKNNEGQIPYDCVRDEEDPCARAVGFNMQMRSIGPTGLQSKVICSDISNGRESYPIEVVRRPRKSKINNDIDDDTILPDFRYITKSILLQNSIQIDQRVSQMRICSCVDSCTSEMCQCSTISVQNWYTSEGRLNGDFNFDDPPMIFECNDVCGCNKLTCKNRVVQSGMKWPLQVFECEQRTKGWGVRTLREIPRGGFVAEYTGEILTDMEADRRTDDSYFFDLGSSDHCIDANYYGNISRFFNHSCSSNIVPVRVYYDHQDYRFPKIAFFACKTIAVGEELAFDYGEKFWAVKQKYFTCKCKSPECRFSSTHSSERNQLINDTDQSPNSSAAKPIIIHI